MLFFLFGCIDNEAIPEGIMPKQQFSEVMADYHLADKIASAKSLPFDSSKVVFYSTLYPQVLEAHGTNFEEFNQSFEFYSKNIIHMDDIYKRVVKILENKEGQIPVGVKLIEE